ncbi:hypothetical protein BDV97DRAFT_233610 [Delphinella strobiligena]|nr:hypothetical protein BDV97DRAFT_233610 [Delphinella strobiligena]
MNCIINTCVLLRHESIISLVDMAPAVLLHQLPTNQGLASAKARQKFPHRLLARLQLHQLSPDCNRLSSHQACKKLNVHDKHQQSLDIDRYIDLEGGRLGETDDPAASVIVRLIRRASSSKDFSRKSSIVDVSADPIYMTLILSTGRCGVNAGAFSSMPGTAGPGRHNAMTITYFNIHTHTASLLIDVCQRYTVSGRIANDCKRSSRFP